MKISRILFAVSGMAVLICIIPVSFPATIRAAFSETGSATPEDARKIIAWIDQMYRSKSSYSEVSMNIVTPHWQRTLEFKAWTRGTDRTFIRVVSPKREQGVATLRIKSEMWNFLPKTDKVIKIPPSMMMSSWMGSDFTNDDLVKEISFVDDYSYELTQPPDSDTSLLYVRCVPHENVPVVWGSVIIAAGREGYLPMWEKYYDEKGALMRTITFSDVTGFGDRTLPATMELIPENKEGNRTVIHYEKLVFDADVGDEIFSLRNLQTIE